MDGNKKYVIETIQESAVKSVYGAIPFVGTALNELYQFSSTLTQKRIMGFVEKLCEYMEGVDENIINIDNIKKEEFHDIFKSIMNKVINTKSDEKLKRFRILLIKPLLGFVDFDEIETYINVTDKLTDAHFRILVFYDGIFDTQINLKELINNENKVITELNKLLKEVDVSKNSTMKKRQIRLELNDKIKKSQENLKNLSFNFSYGGASVSDIQHVFGVSESKYSYLVFELASMYLLEQGNYAKAPIAGGNSYSLSVFGKEYLKFIREA